MPIEDIGYFLFVELLRMTQYPGAPFTGEIIRDIIMFVFIPSVFIIVIIYMLLGRLVVPGANQKLRLLIGVAIYLFIIAGGYYPVFAYLAGPYFIFLIFILGLLYFVFGHFGVRRVDRLSGGALGGSGSTKDEAIWVRLKELDREIEDALKELQNARAAQSRDEAAYWAQKYDKLKEERDALQKKIKPWKKYI